MRTNPGTYQQFLHVLFLGKGLELVILTVWTSIL